MTQSQIRQFMELAVEEMRKSISENRNDKATPKVGAVLVTETGELVETAHRGELRQGDHAEYTLLDRKLRKRDLTGLIVFATLEPCAHGARKHPKIECAQRIVNARIKKVYVGIEDPDPTVATKGIKFLRDSGVEVEMFEKDLQDEIEKENKEFLDGATQRAAETKRVSPVLLTYLEKKVDEATIDEFDDQALQLYIDRAGLKMNRTSAQFLSLLNQLELIKAEKKIFPRPSNEDNFRRNDVMPIIRYSGGLVAGHMEDKFRNEGDRANIISFIELEENQSYLDIPLGWVNKGQEFKLNARPKSRVDSNSDLGYAVEIHYTDKDEREYKLTISHQGNRGIKLGEPELVNKLRGARLYRPTGLGIILFGKNPRNRFPQAGLKVEIRYGSREPELHDLDMALVLLPDRIEELLTKVLRSSISRNRFHRQSEYEIPLSILREVVINAIVHRNYDIVGAKSYLIINPNEIIVRSPGLPVEPIKFVDFQSFRAPSLSRNPKLMAVFNAMKFVEERGIGMTSMSSMPEYGLLRPVVSYDDPYLTITFQRPQF